MKRNRLYNTTNNNQHTESYYDKYRKKLDEFWQLQQIEKTEEENEYENLIAKLQNMLNDFKDQIENLEKKNEKLQEKIGDISSLREYYHILKLEDSHLTQLQKEIDDCQYY